MSNTQTALCGRNPASMQCSLKDKLSRWSLRILYILPVRKRYAVSATLLYIGWSNVTQSVIRYDRHFVGITRQNALSQMAKIYSVVTLNQWVQENVYMIIDLPTKRRLFKRYHSDRVFTYRMAAKIKWRGCGTKLHQCNPIWPLMWVNRPLQVSQLGQLSLSSFLGR